MTTGFLKVLQSRDLGASSGGWVSTFTQSIPEIEYWEDKEEDG